MSEKQDIEINELFSKVVSVQEGTETNSLYVLKAVVSDRQGGKFYKEKTTHFNLCKQSLFFNKVTSPEAFMKDYSEEFVKDKG